MGFALRSTMRYQKSTLENGLRVVTLANPAACSVTLGLLVEAGTRAEGAGQSGLAHLLEHMMFQGSSNRDAMEIARLMDGAGGRIGGFTSRDYACYFAQVLEEFVPYAIDLLGDVLLNSVFSEAALEREKHAILCEQQGSHDNPEQRTHELMRSLLWPDHSLGRPILGDQDNLQAARREDLIYFLHTHYQPNRMVIAAAGNLHHEDIVAQVRDAFWRLLGERPQLPGAPPVAQRGLVIDPAPLSQTYFSLGLEAPPFASPHRYKAHLLNQILGAGISSRLFSNLREQHGLVYHVGSTYDAWRDAGLMTIEGSTTADSLTDALGHIFDELRHLISGQRPILEEELHRAKVRLRSQIKLAAEDTHALMSQLATQELYFGRHVGEAEVLEEIDAIDLDSLQRWLETSLAFGFDHCALAVTGPLKEPVVGQLNLLFHASNNAPSPNLGPETLSGPRP